MRQSGETSEPNFSESQESEPDLHKNTKQTGGMRSTQDVRVRVREEEREEEREMI